MTHEDTAVSRAVHGAIVRRRRLALGLEQPDVAEHFGVSRQTVWVWETGKIMPRPEVEEWLADELRRFGCAVAAWRTEDGRTQTWLAQHLSVMLGRAVTAADVGRWESGEDEIPVDAAAELRRMMGVDR